MAPEHVKLQYEENARVAAAFWEWRHKLMTFSFAVLSGLVVVVGWLVRHNVSHRLVALPLGMGAMLAFGSAALDFRVGSIIRMTFHSGRHLEEKMGDRGGVYTRLANSKQVMSKVLPAIYILVGIAFAYLAIFELAAHNALH